MATQRSAALPLALAYAALVLYASLYPFSGWRWPSGASAATLLALHWPPWREPFDIWSNVLGYVPLGALLYVSRARAGQRWWRAALGALFAASALSYLAELTQQFLPGRVPSRVDWTLNSAGAAAGVILAASLHALGLLQRWQAVRERWFVHDSAIGLSLLALWPAGLLFPTPVPLGLGHTAVALRDALTTLFGEAPWAQRFVDWLHAAPLPMQPLPPFSDGLVQMLGVLAPCLLAISVAQRGGRRVWLLFGIVLVGVIATTLSTALSFAPAHALAWVTPQTSPALALGVALALACTLLPRRAAAGLGLAVLGALVVLVNQAPVDPYFAHSLQAWEQGRFIRFNGLALWIGRLWPYVAMAWLLGRLWRRSGTGDGR